VYLKLKTAPNSEPTFVISDSSLGDYMLPKLAHEYIKNLSPRFIHISLNLLNTKQRCLSRNTCHLSYL